MKSIAQIQEIKFLALTLTLVLFLGLGSFLNLVKAPDRALAAKNSEIGVRIPASVPGELLSQAPASALNSLENLEWSCGEGTKNIEVSSHRIRVKGRGCGKESLSITNETNGLVATVFNGEKGYSTEYMDLNPGKNDLHVKWQNKKGLLQSVHLTVHRK
jgi:hypothetical protein